MRDVFKVVQANTQRASMEQRKHYDLRRRAWRPTLESLVLAQQHHLSKAADNFAAKLAQVVKFISNTIVRLQHTRTKQRRTASLGDLKEAVDDPETQSPVPVEQHSPYEAKTTEQV